ncbi:MAG: hypothetical protein ACYTFG_20620, partial [Planctomycetota bacterium]
MREAFPIESARHRMEVKNLRWTDIGPEFSDNPRLHKKIKTRDQTLSAKLMGTVSIREKGGRVVDSKKNFVLVTLPHITNRSSYIVNGNEVQTVNQLRLRPGPYTRFTADNNTETFINAAGGGYRVIFNRETQVFRLRSGSTYVYLYPILKGLGITDGELIDAWGTEILSANKKYDKPGQLEKLFGAMRRYSETPKDRAELAASVESFFKSKAIDPKISELTLKEAFNNITPKMILAASEKAINLAAGAVDPDDTESLAFKSIHSVEDFVPERLGKAIKSPNGPVAQIRRMMDRKPQITSLMSPASFSDPVIGWFTTSEFTRYSNQQNPIDILSTNQLTTTMGDGGIRSTHAITDQLRVVHPSQMGILDPLHTPEGGKIGVTGHLTLGATKKGNRLEIKVYDVKAKRTVSKTPQDLEKFTVAFNDQYDFSVKPPRARLMQVAARIGGEIRLVPSTNVDYIFADPKTFFSVTTNSVPFLTSNHGNRVLMGDRHVEQSVPLVNPDKPFVQAAYKGKMGYEDFLGQAMSLTSPVDGKIRKITKDSIVVYGTDRKTHT